MLVLLIIALGLIALFWSMYNSSKNKNTDIRGNYKPIIYEELNDETLSTEEKLANYYNQLTSPRDKSVIIDFAESAGIDLNNPKPLSQENLSTKQKSEAKKVIKASEEAYAQDALTYEAIEPVVNADAAITTKEVKQHKAIDSANYLLFAGAALVVVALLFFANAASETFGTGVRFFALTLSSLLLYAAGIWVYNYKEALKPVGSAFIWIAILSVPAIGFSLYRDILDSSLGNISWFIASLIGVFYVLFAYKILKTNQYLEYLTYAASLNMLLATVSVVNVNIKLYSIVGILYAGALVILHSKGVIGRKNTLPQQISIIIAIVGTLLFGLSSIFNFSYSEAGWMGVYGIALGGYIVSFAKLYSAGLSYNSRQVLYALSGLILPWSISLIFSSATKDFSSYLSLIPIALSAIFIASLLFINNYRTEFYKNWIAAAAVLALSSAIVSPNSYATAVVYGLFALIMLLITIKKQGATAPILALIGLPTSLLIANNSSNTLDFIPALSLASAIAFLLGVVLVFFKTINQKVVAVLSIFLWLISVFSLITQGYFAEAGIMIAAGAVTLLIWQRQFYPLPLMNFALPLSLISPLVGFIDAKSKITAYLVAIFILILWAIAVKFYRILFRSPWFVVYIVSGAILNLLAIINLTDKQASLILAATTVISAVFLYLGKNLYQWIRGALSVNLTYTFLLAVFSFAQYKKADVSLVLLISALSLYIIGAVWPKIIKNNVIAEHKISTYIRVATSAALVVLSFVPSLYYGELNNKTLYAVLAVIASTSVMAEGFLINNARLRYIGSGVILCTFMQLLNVLGVKSDIVYVNIIGLYLAGLAYVVYTYRGLNALANKLILGAVWFVLLMLSFGALSGDAVDSLALLIESSLIAVIAGIFKNKGVLKVSIGILIVSIIYRASAFLASIPTWVWYLLVGAGLIAAAAYMLSKNNKQ